MYALEKPEDCKTNTVYIIQSTSYPDLVIDLSLVVCLMFIYNLFHTYMTLHASGRPEDCHQSNTVYNNGHYVAERKLPKLAACQQWCQVRNTCNKGVCHSSVSANQKASIWLGTQSASSNFLLCTFLILQVKIKLKT